MTRGITGTALAIAILALGCEDGGNGDGGQSDGATSGDAEMDTSAIDDVVNDCRGAGEDARDDAAGDPVSDASHPDPVADPVPDPGVDPGSMDASIDTIPDASVADGPTDAGGWDAPGDVPVDAGVDPGVDGGTTDAGADDPVSDPGGVDDPADVPEDSLTDTLADAATDPAEDSATDTAPDPGGDVPGDGTDDAGSTGICDQRLASPQVLYLSADDSTSMASPVIVRSVIRSGHLVPEELVRPWEFTNYYDIGYAPAHAGTVDVHMHMLPGDGPGLWDVQIGAQSHAVAPADRRPVNVTMVLDTSGSMSGDPIALERDVCNTIAGSLRAGDVVSMVTWDTSNAVVLDSHHVSGPHDPILRFQCNLLVPGGGTDLNAGLTAGYDLATDNYDPAMINRVVLVSDGQTNAGVTDIEIIAAAAQDALGEGIYLVGVGVGEGYNDRLMDEVTDAGRGAYVFLDSTEEAELIFGDRFVSTMDVAALDVQLELTLPSWLRMEVFHGEEMGMDPVDVEPQYLAPNDAMIFVQSLVSCDMYSLDEVIRAVARYTDPVSGVRYTSEVAFTHAQLLASQSAPQLLKGLSIVDYAEGLVAIDHMIMSGDRAGAEPFCLDLQGRASASAAATGDPDLVEIAGLLATYCGNVPTATFVALP